ncbi:MAG: carboxypeptidase regulatory-like domain-containing protein [Chloroflexi bacterium]|nr:carboxypeptidase regulatory-like domain-containing protein [Chloroflexota bacterium]
MNTNTTVATNADLGRLTGFSVAPDGATLYAGGQYTNLIYAIDTATLVAAPIYMPGSLREMAVTCDGRYVYAASGLNFVPIIDAATYTVDNLHVPSFAMGIALCPQTVSTGAILYPSVQRKDAALGTAVTYTTTLRNETGQTDSFDLSLAGAAWPAELSTPTLGPLAQGATANFAVTVTVPAGAAWYDTDALTVTAVSVVSPTVYSDTAVLHTQAYAAPQLGVAPDSLSSTQLVNSQVTQTLTISNGNGVTLTYDFGVFYSPPTPAATQLLSVADRPTEWLLANPAPQPLAEPTTAPGTAVAPTSLVPILTDPPGDGGPADVLEVLAENTGTAVTMQLLFNAGVIPQNVYGNIFLDTDQNADTGASPTNFSGLSSQDVGLEYYVSLFNAPNNLEVYSISSGYVGSLAPVYTANTLLFTIPLAMLNNDDGNMNVAMVLGDFFGPTEWVPEVGHGVIGSSGQYNWLVVSPVDGELVSNSSAEISVTYDSSNLQPGLYPASIRVRNNDPTNAYKSVPVALTVEPTASMGWVEGYVTDYRFGTPLPATIIAQGQPYTITAAANGYYKLWLEAGSYDLHVANDGYVSQQHPVVITAQQSTELNVALVEDAPVFGLSPASISISQYVGSVTDETMTLSNGGPAVMTFAIGERDTTSGLALLAPFTRSAGEMAALQSAKPAGDEHNTGAPTIAAIPAEAFAALQGSTNLLAWTLYTDYYWEYTNSLNAIAQFTTFNLTETDTENPVILAALLATADVFLIPEQEGASGGYLFSLGQTWANALQTFVNQGGTIVLLDHCNETFQLLQGAGLVDMQLDYCTGGNTLEVVNGAHPLVENVPPTFIGLDGLALYLVNDGEPVVKAPNSNSTAVMGKDIAAGHIAVIGFDYYSYNDDMARILANAVQWSGGDVPWLTTTPVTGTVPGYDALDAAVTLDATGRQPGLYTADLIVRTNDLYTPTQVLPVSMEVLPTAVMGHVAGAISDAWTGSPLTATVQLQGVYTMTADPTFDIWADAGTYTLTAFAPGYVTETVTVVIPAGGLLTQNLALVPAQPRLDGLPESVTVTAVAGQSITHSFTLSNTGPVPLNFAWNEMLPPTRLGEAADDLEGKSILFDVSRGGSGLSNFSLLVQDITAAGGVVVENYSNPITPALLAPHDVLWVACCGYTNWSPAELTAISDWLQQGGAIFLYGGGTTNTSQLAQLFEIDYTCCYYYYGDTTNILPHPTTEGINTVFISYGEYAFTFTPDADVLFYDPSGSLPVAVAQEENGGRIVVVAAYTFEDWSVNYADNRDFALNIMDWLASPVYTDVPWVNTEPVTGTILGYTDQSFSLTFDAADLAPGAHHMMLALQHNDQAHNPVLFVPVTFEVVAQTAAVAVVADTISQTAVPGQSATYQIVITNQGNAPDSFAIAAAGDWNATLSAANTGLLAVGQSFTATVTVAVPGTAVNGSSKVTAVTVTSAHNPAISQTLSLTTTAVIPVYKLYLPVTVRP